MDAIIDSVIKLYKAFNGSSYFMLFFFAALLYLYLSEEKKPVKIMLLYLSILILALFLFPVFAYLVQKVMDEEIYYRTMWLLPITIVVPYGITKLIGTQKNLKRKVVILLMCVGFIMYGGSYVYTNSEFTKAENVYHLPQEVIDVCDYIKKPDWVVKAAFPPEMVSFVRQYSSSIELAYGREMLVAAAGYNDIYYAMSAETIDVPALVELLRQGGYTYLILPKEKAVSEPVVNYNFELINTIDGYRIYLDTKTAEN